MDLFPTPPQDSYESSIQEGGGETEPTGNESNSAPEEDALFSFDDTPTNTSVISSDGGKQTENLGRSGKTLDRLEGYTTRFGDLDQAFADAAINQGVWGALGNGAVRAAAEIVGGSIEGVGALVSVFDSERLHHQNFLEEIGQTIRESTDGFEIWERNQGDAWQFTDAAWWAKNLPSIASSLSMMVPGMAVARGVSLLGKGARLLGKAARIGNKTKKGLAITERAAQQIGGGFGMRHAENMREAHDVYNQAKEDVLNSGYNYTMFEGTDGWQAFAAEHNRAPANMEELADYIGGAAAKRAYRINSVNLISDVAQFSAFGKLFKATRGAATAATAARVAGTEVTKRGAAAALAGKIGKFVARDMASEGAEEIVNFIGGEEGKYHGMRLAGLGSESTLEDRMATYMSDDHMWEAGFFGALGGGVFTGARSATSKIKGTETKQQEQIAAAAEARQAALGRAGEVAAAVEKGDMSAAQGRDEVNNLVFQGAHQAASDGTVDIFAESVESAAAQMEKEGVSAEQVKQFREDSAEAIKVAEASVQEIGTILATMPELGPEAATLLRGQHAHNALRTNRNRVLRDSTAKRLEGHKNLPEQRSQALTELQEEISAILKNTSKDSAEYKEAAAMQEFVDQLVSENPVAEQENVVDDSAVNAATENQSMAEQDLTAADAKVAELQGKDTTSMTAGAKTQLANELTDAYVAQKEAQDRVAKAKEEVATAEEGTPPPPVKVDDLVYEDVLLEAESLALGAQKIKILSKENVEEAIKEGEEFKKQLEEAKALKEELEGMTAEELELQKKRAHGNKTRHDAILAEIEKRKLAAANDKSTVEEQRSKDIEVGAIAQAAIDKMVADTQNQELVDENGNPADGNGKYYRDKRDGKLRMRVTSFIGEAEEFAGSPNYGIMASNVGNSIDLYIRDYMDGNIGQNEYPHLPEELRPALDAQLAQLEAGFVAKGEKVVPHDITLISDTTLATDKDSNVVGIAGTVDLITVDKDGVLRVYDMKTMRDALAEKAIYKDGKKVGSGARLVVNKDGTTSKFGPRQDKSQSNKYNKQTSLYALMAENSTGLEVAGTALIPIDVSYGRSHKENVAMSEAEANAQGATSATLLPNIPQERLEEVEGYKKEEETSIPDEIVPDDTTPADSPVEPDQATPTDEPSAPVELELDDMALPMTGILSYFAERLGVSKDWGRDHMLVHSSTGPVVVTDAEVEQKYNLIQKAITPGSGAVVRVETRSTGNLVNRVEFGDYYGNKPSSSIEGVQEQQGTKENKNRNRSYIPNAADGVEMVITIDGVEVGVMPTVSELIEAADQRRLLERKDFRKSFAGTTRVGKVKFGENALMTEISADAHFTAAINAQKFRQAIYAHMLETGTMPVVRLATAAGRTALGNRAFGSLILDNNKLEDGLTAEATGDSTVLTEGVAIMLPGIGQGQALQVMGEEKALVTPYASNEKEGSSTAEQAAYSSGSLFMPVNHNGQTLWVKAPGQSISQLVNGEKIGDALVELVRSANDNNIAAAQNLLGSNALRKTESGNWAIYPTNQNGGIIANQPPLTEAVNGVWTNDLSTIIPQMPLDIAVKVAAGESAYKSGGVLSLIPEGKEEGISFKNLAEFAHQNVRLGHAPVTNAKGEVLGWTHPLAPAVSRFDTGENRVYNENTNKTQLKVTMRPQTIEGVSGAKLVQELTPTEESEVVEQSQAPSVSPEAMAALAAERAAKETTPSAPEPSKLPQSSTFGFSSTELTLQSSNEYGNNGIVGTYIDPATGEVAAVIALPNKQDDSAYLGYKRLKNEDGSYSNQYAIKADLTNARKGTGKSTFTAGVAALPEGHELIETDNISTDGIALWRNQIKNGYKPTGETFRVPVNAAGLKVLLAGKPAKGKDLFNIAFFDAQRFQDVDEATAQLNKLLDFIPGAKLIKNGGNSVSFEVVLPVLKAPTTEKTTEPAAPTQTLEELQAKRKEVFARQMRTDYVTDGETFKELEAELAALDEAIKDAKKIKVSPFKPVIDAAAAEAMRQRLRRHKQDSKKNRKRYLTVERAEAAANGEKASPLDMKVAEDWWAKNMPNVPFKRVKGMIKRGGTTAYGIFEAGAVQVSDLAIKGTEYHEAFHAVFHMFLDDSRQAKVLAEMRKKYPNKNEEQLEEELAEEFREYMLTDGLSNKDKSVVRRFFSELMELIGALLRGNLASTRLAQQINRGTFSNMTPRTNEFTTRFMKAIPFAPEYNAEVIEELQGTLRRYAGHQFRSLAEMNDPMLDGFRTIQAMTSAEIKEQFPDSTRKELLTQELLSLTMNGEMFLAAEDAKLLMPADSMARENLRTLFEPTRMEAVIMHFAKDSKFQSYVEDLISNEQTVGTNETEQYDEKKFQKMNPKDSLTQTVRDLIEATPQITRATLNNSNELKQAMALAEVAMLEVKTAKDSGNETAKQQAYEKLADAIETVNELSGKTAHSSFFGLPRGMNVDLNFPYLSQKLASAATPQDMLERLMEMGRVYPEFKLLAMNLQEQSKDTLAQFFTGLKRTGAEEVTVKKGFANASEVFSRTLASRNQATVAAALADITNLDAWANKIKKIKEDDFLSQEQKVEKLGKALRAMGFTTVDSAAFEVSLALAAEAGEQNLNNLFTYAEGAVRAYSRLAESSDDTGEALTKDFNGMIEKLSVFFADNDRGAISSTINNVEGTRIFSKQVPSFIGEWFNQFEQRAGETDTMYETRLREKVFADPRMYVTNYGRLIFNGRKDGNFDIKAARRMGTRRLGGIEGGKGTTYTNMSDEQGYQYQLATLKGVRGLGSMYPVTTLSDAGNSYIVPAVVFNPATEAGKNKALLALRDVILAETAELRVRKGRYSNPAVNAYMRSKFSTTEGDFFTITTSAQLKQEAEAAAQILFKELQKEASKLEKDPSFVNGHKATDTGMSVAEAAMMLTTTGYVSNFSTAVALAGTANEFKQNAGKNTTDMQKRHKHIASPGVSNAGVTQKTHFRSVTMKDVKFDLTDVENGGTAELAKFLDAKGKMQYGGVEIADAQSYVTLDFYESILIEHGDMTPELQTALDKARAGQTLTANEKQKLFRPYKPFYYARTMAADGLMQSQQIKNSIIPLLPDMPGDFGKLAKWMNDPKNKIDQVQMGTAHKVGNTKGEVELINEDGSFEVKSFKEENIHTLPMSGYRKQVHVTDHWHDDSTNKMMSQMERIAIAHGVLKRGEEGLATRNKFMAALDDIYTEQADSFFSQFDNGNNGTDVAKLSSWLADKLESQDVPAYVIDQVKQGNFTSPTVIGAVRAALFSAIENEGKQVRVFGGTQVQISSQFHSTRKNRLKGMRLVDGKVAPAQIVVSRDYLPKTYKGDSIADMSFEEIKSTHPELLEMFCVRIPSEAPNSGSMVEVVEFLQEGQDGAIVPDEFVTQMGSDFDVDKLVFQWRDTNAKTSLAKKANELYDMIRETYMDPRMLSSIQAPQGFDTLSDIAETKGLRSAEDQQFIKDNPYAVTTHTMMLGDNRAGIALKGQAANKNLILQDFIRNGFKFKADFSLGTSSRKASFDATKVSPELVLLHTEMVAAAMDGAKDPVYGKLGVNNENFGLFSALLMTTNGDLDFAVSVIQSEPMQMVAKGHIEIKGSSKNTVLKSKTKEGEVFIGKIAKTMNLEQKSKTSVALPANRNLFTPKTGLEGDAKWTAIGLTASGIGQFQHHIATPLNEQGDAMRIDRVGIAKGVEGVMDKEVEAYSSLATGDPDNNIVTQKDYATADGGRTAQPFDVETKGSVRAMFVKAGNILTNAGDNYLRLRSENAGSVLAKSMTFQMHDEYIRQQAAEEIAANETIYTAMGERDTRAVSKLPELKESYSLEQWTRVFNKNAELVAGNENLALVLSKIQINPVPYSQDGKYFDNAMLMNVNDDVELIAVQKALNALYESGDTDMVLFADAIGAYEAQRSRYGLSQSRFTRVLPDALQTELAKESGAAGVNGLDVGFETILAIHAAQVHNPNLPYMSGETVADAIDNAVLFNANTAYRAADNHVIIPIGEDKGKVQFVAVKSPNDGQKFAGKPVDVFGESTSEAEVTVEEEAKVQEQPRGGTQTTLFSKLPYGKDNSTAAKVAHLEARFAKAGIPVTVKFDSSLDVNGQVVIDKGAATITMHPNKLQRDTVAHEFGHVLVEALGFTHPLVQQAIGELEGSKLWNEVAEAYSDLNGRDLAMEVLVTSIGREATDIFESGDPKTNRFRTTMNRILRAIGKVFGITPKATSQLAEMLMDDGPLPTLSEQVSTVQQQRGKKTGTQVAEDFKKKWGELAQQFQTRKFTSTEFEVAASRFSRQHDLVAKKKNVGTKLEAMHQVAKTELLRASAVTSQLTGLTGTGFSTNRIGDEEAIALSEAHSTLQALETLRSVLEGMDPEAGGSVKVREAYESLQEELDRIVNAELTLKQQLTETISKQLVNNSTNPKLLAWVNNPENSDTIFELVNDPEMRDMMTDVDKATMGTLGVKEFNNPVMQLIAKQIADTVEQGRIDGRQAEIRIASILKKAKAEGVELKDIVDMETGKFITENTAEYTEGAREARIMLNSGREGEWIKFHAKNSELPQNSKYYKSYRFPTVSLRAKVEEVNELKTARKLYGLKSYDSAIEQAEAEMQALLEAKKEMMAEFNDFAVDKNFKVARDAAEDAGTDVLRKFDAEHGVVEVNGKLIPMNEHSRFVTMTVKPEYKNDNYPADADGRPVPKKSQKNTKFDNLTPAASAALTAIRKEMKDALGADSKFLQDGDVPFIKSASNETSSILERLKKGKDRATKGVQNLTDKSQDLKNAERVLVDASGNPIYTRDRIARPATAEEMAGLNMDSFAAMLGESTKRAHLESAKAGLEPFAYMTRDVFNQSDVVDGKHVILMGKKGERARQWRSRKVEGSNISVALDSWLEGMIGDNWEDASRLDAPVAAFQTYTSLMGVGINLTAWFNNFAYGNIQRHLETAGAEHYDKEHGKRAWSIVSSDIITLTNDIVSGKRSNYTSRTSALVNLLDIADDQREMPFGKRETKGSSMVNLLFVGQTMGEVLMQNQTAFAMMMNQEVKLKDGTTSNLFDCFIFEDGNVRLPEGATVERNGETVDLDNNFLAGFRNKAKSLNHHIHGAYNKQDSGTWQRVAWGRAIMQFRRWLPMNVKKRFGKDVYNESRERQEAGWYTSMWQFLGIVAANVRDMKAMKEAIQQMKEESPHMYKGAKRALVEVGSGIAGFLALALMYGMLDDEDEDNYWVGLGLNRAQRLVQEMNTYTPWGLFDTFNSMAENPFAAMTRLDGGLKALHQLVEDGAGYIVHGEGFEVYQSGVNKGKTKLGTLMGKMTPGVSHGMRLMQVGEMQKQYSTAKNIADWFEG